MGSGGMEHPDNMQPPAEGQQPPEGFTPPEGQQPPEGFTPPEGQQPPEGFPGMIMQVSGSLTQDAGALAQEQSVMQLIQLFQSLSGQNASPVQPAPGMFGIGG